MMPVRGLTSEEICLPKRILNARHGVYFSALMMCMWDNIHGPKVLNVWTGEEPVAPAPPMKARPVEVRKDGDAVAIQIDPEDVAAKSDGEQLPQGEICTCVHTMYHEFHIMCMRSV